MLVMRAVTDSENAVDDRPKNFLTGAEVADFLKAARKGRHGIRNYAMLLLAFRHGLRVSELNAAASWNMPELQTRPPASRNALRRTSLVTDRA